MIPILFESTATTFNTYGICPLGETTSCLVTEERNGAFELTLQYPINGKFYDKITVGRIIKAKPNETSNPQAFRIYRITVPINGIITVYAQHISYDLSNIIVMPFSLENVNPGAVMAYALSNTVVPNNFSFSTEFTSTNSVLFEKPISIRSILGGQDLNILNLWGGEYEWDNFVIKHYYQRGADNGVLIEYGKNLTKFDHDNEITNVFSDLLPYAFNTNSEGDKEIVTLPEKTISVTTTLTTRKVVSKDFSEVFEDGVTITSDMLREVANQFILENPFGSELPSITVSFEPLWKLPDYSKLLEKISLCDTVTIRHSILGITAKAKVIKTVYDCLIEKYKTITVGSAKSSFTDRVGNVQNQTNNNKTTMDMLPEMVAASIKNATETITGNNGGYVVLRRDNLSNKPYELLVMDNEKIEDATKVWRWNNSGLGYSPNGYNGPYTTAITADGKIVADFITTGSLTANVITAGTIKSSDNSSYWNVETGELSINGSITTHSGTIGGFTIDNNSLSKGTIGADDSVLLCTGSTGYASIAGSPNINGWVLASGKNFGVTKDGYLYANNAKLQGEINASSGYVSNFKINSEGISTGPTNIDDTSHEGLYLGNSGVNFVKTADGYKNLITLSKSGYPRLFMENSSTSASETIWYKVQLTSDYLALGSYYSDADFKDCTIKVKRTGNITGASSANIIAYPSINSFSESVQKGNENDGVVFTLGAGHIWDNYTGYVNDVCIQMNAYSAASTSNYGYLIGTWKSSGAISVTSDRNKKKEIKPLNKNYEALFDNLKPVRFKYKDGTSNRFHTGFIAQDVLEAISKSGLSENELAAVCSFGDPKENTREWGLRYEELIALNTYKIQRLNEEIIELKEKIRTLEDKNG